MRLGVVRIHASPAGRLLNDQIERASAMIDCVLCRCSHMGCVAGEMMEMTRNHGWQVTARFEKASV